MHHPSGGQGRRWAGRCTGLLAGLALWLAGCDDGDFSHHPPPGQGCIIVDNRTLDTIQAYVGGFWVFDVSGQDYEYVDLDPGEYRVVLDEKHGYRTFRDFIDVLADERTILEVLGGTASEYDVRVYFD